MVQLTVVSCLQRYVGAVFVRVFDSVYTHVTCVCVFISFVFLSSALASVPAPEFCNRHTNHSGNKRLASCVAIVIVVVVAGVSVSSVYY